MNFDGLNDLPDWDDDYIKGLSNDEEGEDWKPNPTREACKAMYTKWNEVIMMLNGVLEDAEDEDEPGQHSASFIAERKNMILGDAFEVAAKIRSSETGNMYILRMENAAIIRKNAQMIKSAMLTFNIDGEMEDSYCEAIRTEIDNFRELFKQWVATFQKDVFEDDWGLFV
ncbi:MAG TPA: hypothetical protein VG738_14260 [Chitinophagaceae bacterium]|nr:hypothetical protein [Chitinophagaceae bacterium]